MTTQMLGAVFVVLSLIGLIVYGVRRFFLEVLAGEDETTREQFSELR